LWTITASFIRPDATAVNQPSVKALKRTQITRFQQAKITHWICQLTPNGKHVLPASTPVSRISWRLDMILVAYYNGSLEIKPSQARTKCRKS